MDMLDLYKYLKPGDFLEDAMPEGTKVAINENGTVRIEESGDDKLLFSDYVQNLELTKDQQSFLVQFMALDKRLSLEGVGKVSSYDFVQCRDVNAIDIMFGKCSILMGGVKPKIIAGLRGAGQLQHDMLQNMSFVSGSELLGHSGSGAFICDGIKNKIEGFPIFFFTLDQIPYCWYFDQYKESYVVERCSRFYLYGDMYRGKVYVEGSGNYESIFIGDQRFPVISNDYVPPDDIVTLSLGLSCEGIIMRVNGMAYKVKRYNTYELKAINGVLLTADGIPHGSTDMSGLVEVGGPEYKLRWDKVKAHTQQEIEIVCKAPRLEEVSYYLAALKKSKGGFFKIPSFAELAGNSVVDGVVPLISRNVYGYIMRSDVFENFKTYRGKKWENDVKKYFKQKVSKGRLNYMSFFRLLTANGCSFTIDGLITGMVQAGLINKGLEWIVGEIEFDYVTETAPFPVPVRTAYEIGDKIGCIPPTSATHIALNLAKAIEGGDTRVTQLHSDLASAMVTRNLKRVGAHQCGIVFVTGSAWLGILSPDRVRKFYKGNELYWSVSECVKSHMNVFLKSVRVKDESLEAIRVDYVKYLEQDSSEEFGSMKALENIIPHEIAKSWYRDAYIEAYGIPNMRAAVRVLGAMKAQVVAPFRRAWLEVIDEFRA